MDVTEFLKFCDLQVDQELYWLEDAKKRKLEKIDQNQKVLWVKSKLSCQVVLAYLPLENGRRPTVNISLPKEGMSKEQLIKTIDQNLLPKLYQIEDRNRRTLPFILP